MLDVIPLGSPSICKPLLPIPDAEDLANHSHLCDPELVTQRLGELVPLLKFIGFRVEQMTPGKTVLTVPLLETAMNQNGTHQAAVFYLIADYTLGVGMFATLPGCYTVGVHDRCHALPVQFWLKGARVEHHAPGTGLIRSEVTITPAQAATMRAQLIAKGRCELKGTVNIYQGDQLIAVTEHEMGLYADLPRVTGKRASLTQMERAKTSALMIAGLRGDPISTAFAEDQGVAIARRMCRASPQLPTMVSARTLHLEKYLESCLVCHDQILILGVGLDPKPLLYSGPSQKWFLCDLRATLNDRAARLKSMGRQDEHCVTIPIDLRMDGWPSAITEAGFDPRKSTLIILEGVSMYLDAGDLRKTITNINSLCGHPDSRFWFDHVTERLLIMPQAEVRAFLSAMARLGEPFVTGFSDPVAFFGRDLGLELVENPTAADILEIKEPVHREYKFALLAMRPNSLGGVS